MDAAKWLRFAVLMAFAALFLWLFYVRYLKLAVAQAADPVSAGALWIGPALLFGLFAFATLKRG